MQPEMQQLHLGYSGQRVVAPLTQSADGNKRFISLSLQEAMAADLKITSSCLDMFEAVSKQLEGVSKRITEGDELQIHQLRVKAMLEASNSRGVLFELDPNNESEITQVQPPGLKDGLKRTKESEAALATFGDSIACYFLILRILIFLTMGISLPALVVVIISACVDDLPESSYAWSFGSRAHSESWGGVFTALSSIFTAALMFTVVYAHRTVLEFLAQVPGLVLNSNLYSALVHLGQVLDAECEARLGEHVEELSGLKVVDSIVHGRMGILTMQRTDSVKKLIERNPKTCFGCCRNQDHTISFQGERLVFETAPPPRSIYWDNLGQFSACGLFCRRVGFWLLMLFVGCGFCVGYYFAIQKEYENKYSNRKTNFENGFSIVFFSLLPVVAKDIFTTILVKCESSTQKSATVDYRQVSLFVSTSILSLVVSVLLPFIATWAATHSLDSQSERLQATFSSITLTALLNGIVFNINELFQPVYYLKVLVSYMCCYNTQEKMDNAYALDPWDCYLVYTQMIVTIAYALLFGVYSPLIYMVTLFNLLTMYLTTRYTLFIWHPMPPKVGAMLVTAFIRMFELLFCIEFWLCLFTQVTYNSSSSSGIDTSEAIPMLVLYGVYGLSIPCRAGYLTLSSDTQAYLERANHHAPNYESVKRWFFGRNYRKLREQSLPTQPEAADTPAQQADTPAQQADTPAQQADTPAQQADTPAQQATVVM